jgi:hypothetical protein
MISIIREALIDTHFEGEVMRPHHGGGPFNTDRRVGSAGLAANFLSVLSTGG